MTTVYIHTSMSMGIAYCIIIYDLIGQYNCTHMYMLAIICQWENIDLLSLQLTFQWVGGGISQNAIP